MEEMKQALPSEDTLLDENEAEGNDAKDAEEAHGEQEDANGEAEAVGEEEDNEKDFAALAAADLAEIKSLLPDFANVRHLSELPFAHRFAELREMGLSVKEALYANLPSLPRGSGKSHLTSSVPRGRGIPSDTLSTEEMRAAKDLFYGLSEKEINSLYKRVRSV